MTEAVQDPRKHWTVWGPIVLGLITVVFGSGLLTNWWGWQRADAAELRDYRDEHLGPVQALLTQNRAIYDDLYALYVVEPWGIQESYYLKVRQDGEEPHRIMRARIDRLVANNGRIQDHLQRARSKMLTEQLREQTDRFLEYVGLYIARWEGVREMARTSPRMPITEPFPENFPSGELIFPQELPGALDAEIALVNSRLGSP